MREIPDEIQNAAEERAAARAARDWETADRLRAQIEAAGWKVVDVGTRFRLERAFAEDVVVDDIVRYGRADSVPSRLEDPDEGDATVVIAATDHPEDVLRAVASVRRYAPTASVVVVADAMRPEEERTLDALVDGVEIVRTTARLGHAGALQAGLRRASGRIVAIMDPSVELTGDAVSPLVAALDSDPGVAVAGPFGLASADLRRYDEVAGGEAAAIEAYLMAFRRADARERGPLDARFRFYRNLDIWWSLVLRDEGEGDPPRRALVVPDLPVERHEHRGWTSVDPAERDRLSKRNFYRIIDRFGPRRDLAAPSS